MQAASATIDDESPKIHGESGHGMSTQDSRDRRAYYRIQEQTALQISIAPNLTGLVKAQSIKSCICPNLKPVITTQFQQAAAYSNCSSRVAYHYHPASHHHHKALTDQQE